MSVLAVYNAALSAVGAKGRIASFSDKNRGREECDIWYELVRDTVQEASYWPACRRVERLTFLAERDLTQNWAVGNPEPQYTYVYALPEDYLRAWHMADFARFSISYDNTRSRRVLHTNTSTPVLIYAAVAEEPRFWSPLMRLATIHGLAAHVARPITGSGQMQQMQIQLANLYLERAQTAAANTMRNQIEHVPEALRVRGYDTPSLSAYYMPFGPSFEAAIINV